MSPSIRMFSVAVLLLCVYMVVALPQPGGLADSGRVRREPGRFSIGALPSSWQINSKYTAPVEQAKALIQSRGMAACRKMFAEWICAQAV